MAVSPGDQLLHPEKKKTKAERDAEGDQVDSHADRECSKFQLNGLMLLCILCYFGVKSPYLMSNGGFLMNRSLMESIRGYMMEFPLCCRHVRVASM